MPLNVPAATGLAKNTSSSDNTSSTATMPAASRTQPTSSSSGAPVPRPCPINATSPSNSMGTSSGSNSTSPTASTSQSSMITSNSQTITSTATSARPTTALKVEPTASPLIGPGDVSTGRTATGSAPATRPDAQATTASIDSTSVPVVRVPSRSVPLTTSDISPLSHQAGRSSTSAALRPSSQLTSTSSRSHLDPPRSPSATPPPAPASINQLDTRPKQHKNGCWRCYQFRQPCMYGPHGEHGTCEACCYGKGACNANGRIPNYDSELRRLTFMALQRKEWVDNGGAWRPVNPRVSPDAMSSQSLNRLREAGYMPPSRLRGSAAIEWKDWHCAVEKAGLDIKAAPYYGYSADTRGQESYTVDDSSDSDSEGSTSASPYPPPQAARTSTRKRAAPKPFEEPQAARLRSTRASTPMRTMASASHKSASPNTRATRFSPLFEDNLFLPSTAAAKDYLSMAQELQTWCQGPLKQRMAAAQAFVDSAPAPASSSSAGVGVGAQTEPFNALAAALGQVIGMAQARTG